ncbi:MAG: hypothetical protein ACYTCU_09825 [Planctomycetota bacterium]|jgi:hypothetical protein
MNAPAGTRRGRRGALALGTAAVAVLVLSAGVIGPPPKDDRERELRATLLDDYYRLRGAVVAYAEDTGEFPSPVFDLSGEYDAGLSDRAYVPFRVHEDWAGPYLREPIGTPVRGSFWSLSSARCLHDEDGDGCPDEAWSRVHRADGGIGDATAAWLDEHLDDGVPDQGEVRVTPTWVWLKLAER